MTPAYNKKVNPRYFEVGQLVLKRIILPQEEAKGKLYPNWQGTYLIKEMLSKWDLHLTNVEGNMKNTIVSGDAVKRYYI